MAYDISEIKKLPVKERIAIIDAIWESCVQEDKTLAESEEELISVVEERIEKYESGEMKTIPWDDFIQRLKSRKHDLSS
jgi:putative addiction module component (TIGR02574 family)